MVCQVEEGGRICASGGEAREESKNLLCGSGCMGCGKVAGVFVALLFGPLCRGLQQETPSQLSVLSVLNRGWILLRVTWLNLPHFKSKLDTFSLFLSDVKTNFTITV